MNIEEEEKALVYRVTPKYSLPTRLGNWQDELAVKEYNIKNMIYKKQHCQLLVGKTKNMLENLLAPVTLSTAISTLDYGALYQICAPELPNTLRPVTPQVKGLYLCGLMNEHDLAFSTNFMHGCAISAAPSRTASRRNAFRILNAFGKGGNIYYGDDIYIQLYTPNASVPTLYLQAECSTMDTFGEPLHVRLSEQPDVYCHWQFLHWKTSKRRDAMGSVVAPNQAIVIQHLASGQNLACETRNWIPTLFGPECLITCNTIVDNNRNVTAENVWKIEGLHEVDLGLVIRAAKGEDIPPELLE